MSARGTAMKKDMTEQQKVANKKVQPIFIDLNAFIKEIQVGDSEWFERIATRELQKLKITRTNRG
jgi:hypothetical protein